MKKREELSPETPLTKHGKKLTGTAKTIAACTLAFATIITASFAMVGCGNTGNPGNPSAGTSVSPSSVPTATAEPSTPTVSATPSVSALPIEKYTQLLERMGTNYTYSFSSGNKDVNYYFDGDKVQIKNNKKRISDYHYVDGEKAYDLIYDEETSKWGRYDATGFDVNCLIMDSLRNTRWTAYDEIQNCFVGIFEEKEMTLYLDDEGGTLVGDNYYGCISRIGETSVTLPESEKIYNADPTIEPADPADPAEGSAFYTIDTNGNYVFDIATIQKVFMGKTQNGNTLIDQVYKNCTILNDIIVENVVFINPTAERFQIGVLMHLDPERHKNVDTTTCLSVINDQNDAWKKFVSDPNNNTVSKLKEFLLTKPENYANDLFKFDSKLNQVKVEYTTIDADYETEHKAEFEKLTSIIFETIATKGCKDTAVSDYRDKIAEFNNAKVLFGAKTPKETTVAGLSLGYYNGWRQYYVLEIDGKIEFVDINIASSVTNNVENEKENIYNKNYRWFLVYKVQRTELAPGNEFLFQNKTASQAMAAAFPAMPIITCPDNKKLFC